MPDQKTVLCIDDNASNLRLLEGMFKARQHLNVLSASTSEEGLALALTHQPDLILLDISMPHLDGYEVLARLRQHATLARTPIVAVTAKAQLLDRMKGLALGFTDYVTKPVDVQNLLGQVDRLLSSD
jgi:CheY-like chemotaxis protein